MPSVTNEIEKYDRAVYTYLSTISPRVIYSPTSKAVRTITKKECFSDNKPWDFVSFYRTPSFDIDWNRMNNVGTISGDLVRVTMDTTENTREARYVKNLPINLTYNVELWASKAIEVQDMAVSLISKIYMSDQVLEVPINPDGEMARFHILDVSWTDNSDIEREEEIGKIYRHSISLTIDARLTVVRDIATTALCEVPVNIYDESEGE